MRCASSHALQAVSPQAQAATGGEPGAGFTDLGDTIREGATAMRFSHFQVKYALVRQLKEQDKLRALLAKVSSSDFKSSPG